MTDLQEDIEFGEDGITGTLKYVTGYTGFSGSEELQEGNFLALHFEAEGADTITVEVVGGHSGPQLLDADGIIVARIESTEQSIRAVADFGDEGIIIKEWALDDLTLNES
ncbi:MAG: hypothetical protein IJM87_05845 [Ruminococcus sp.]|nr:hypothetical protein [Ruminococcus sp.]